MFTAYERNESFEHDTHRDSGTDTVVLQDLKVRCAGARLTAFE